LRRAELDTRPARADAASHSYAIEKSYASGWQRVASFLVAAGACKE